MSQVVELGSLTLRHIDLVGELEVTVSIRVSPFRARDFALPTLTPEVLTSNTTWVCRGKNLQLALCFSDLSIRESWPPGVFEHIAEKMKTAEASLSVFRSFVF